MPVDPSRLHELPLLEGLEEAELEQIAASAELRTARPGDVLAREGASGYTFFAIAGGTVDVDRGVRGRTGRPLRNRVPDARGRPPGSSGADQAEGRGADRARPALSHAL